MSLCRAVPMWSTPPRLSRVERRSAGAASLPKLLVRGRLQICRQQTVLSMDRSRTGYISLAEITERAATQPPGPKLRTNEALHADGRAGGRWIRLWLCLAWLSTEALPAAVTREPARVCWIACATPHHAMQCRAMPDSHAARCGAAPCQCDSMRDDRGGARGRVRACLRAVVSGKGGGQTAARKTVVLMLPPANSYACASLGKSMHAEQGASFGSSAFHSCTPWLTALPVGRSVAPTNAFGTVGTPCRSHARFNPHEGLSVRE